MDDFGIDTMVDNDLDVYRDMGNIVDMSDMNNWSNLLGRRSYCKDQGLSGAALRECKRQLKEGDQGLTRDEKKTVRDERKSGSGLVSLMNPNSDQESSEFPTDNGTDERTQSDNQDFPQGGKSNTGIIIGVSVGVLALTGFLIWWFKRKKK